MTEGFMLLTFVTLGCVIGAAKVNKEKYMVMFLCCLAATLITSF